MDPLSATRMPTSRDIKKKNLWDWPTLYSTLGKFTVQRPVGWSDLALFCDQVYFLEFKSKKSAKSAKHARRITRQNFNKRSQRRWKWIFFFLKKHKCFRLYDTLKGAYKGKMILELGSYKHLAQHGKCLTSPPPKKKKSLHPSVQYSTFFLVFREW